MPTQTTPTFTATLFRSSGHINALSSFSGKGRWNTPTLCRLPHVSSSNNCKNHIFMQDRFLECIYSTNYKVLTKKTIFYYLIVRYTVVTKCDSFSFFAILKVPIHKSNWNVFAGWGQVCEETQETHQWLQRLWSVRLLTGGPGDARRSHQQSRHRGFSEAILSLWKIFQFFWVHSYLFKADNCICTKWFPTEMRCF